MSASTHIDARTSASSDAASSEMISSAIRVVITPNQSSYFAGEPFSVTITFTNTRTPESMVSPRSRGHKRAAHSISSAPLARPPTSPVTPRAPNGGIIGNVSAYPIRSRSGDEVARRGLIGRGRRHSNVQNGAEGLVSGSLSRTQSNGGPNAMDSKNERLGELKSPLEGLKTDTLPVLIEQRRKRLLAKSLSVSISPRDLEVHLGTGTLSKSPSYNQRNFAHPERSPTSPIPPSPLARSDILALSSNHPHARKQSVLDGTVTISIEAPTSPYSSTTSPPLNTNGPYSYAHSPALPNSPSASSSTFSLVLDPIAEGARSPYASTPMIASPSIETPTHPFDPSVHYPPPPANSVYAYPPRSQPQPQNRPSNLGLSHITNPPPPHLLVNGAHKPLPSPTGPKSPAPAQPNTELILYSYAQLVGTLALTTVPGALPTPEQARTMNAVRAALLTKTVVGGGSMDITASLAHAHPLSRTPSTSSSTSSLSLARAGALGAPARGARPPHRRTHTRSSSFSTGLLALLGAAAPPAPQPLGHGGARTINTSVSWSSGTPPATAGGNNNNGNNNSGGGVSGTPAARARAASAAHGARARIANAGMNGIGGGGGGVDGPTPAPGQGEEEIDPEVPLPTFEVQPSMLAVDLALAPGESKSC